MSTFTIHDLDTAPTASKEQLQEAKSQVGFVPNLYAVMAESPAMLKGYRTLSDIFGGTNLSETERQIILLTNSRLNGCEYCVAAHTTLSQMAKVPADVIQSLRDGTAIAEAKLEALRQFSMKMLEKRGWVDQGDLDAFFAAGYTQANVLDVIVGTSIKVMSNYTNHIAQTPVDAAFESNIWSSTDNVAA